MKIYQTDQMKMDIAAFVSLAILALLLSLLERIIFYLVRRRLFQPLFIPCVCAIIIISCIMRSNALDIADGILMACHRTILAGPFRF